VAEFELSEWITPPVVTRPSRVISHAVHHHVEEPGGDEFTRTNVYTYDGPYNTPGNIVGDLDLTPTWLTVMNEVLTKTLGAPNDFGWSTPQPGQRLFTTAGWVNTQAQNFNQRPPWHPDGPGFQYQGLMQDVVFYESKALWQDITSVRGGDVPGEEGVDWVRFPDGRVIEYEGLSTSVGWEPGYVLPYGIYWEYHTNVIRGQVEDREHGSPHLEKYRLSGSFGQVIDGDTLPINPNIDTPTASWARAETTGANYVAPFPGQDILLSARHDLQRFLEPAAAPWGTDTDRASDWVNRAEASVSWYWTQLDEDGRFYARNPLLRVQPPRYRYWKRVDREPRFFVIYEDEARPVGFGKPDTERHVFGVQTALGNYRDLTVGEYADAGDPLPDFTP